MVAVPKSVYANTRIYDIDKCSYNDCMHVNRQGIIEEYQSGYGYKIYDPQKDHDYYEKNKELLPRYVVFSFLAAWIRDQIIQGLKEIFGIRMFDESDLEALKDVQILHFDGNVMNNEIDNLFILPPGYEHVEETDLRQNVGIVMDNSRYLYEQIMKDIRNVEQEDVYESTIIDMRKYLAGKKR